MRTTAVLALLLWFCLVPTPGVEAQVKSDGDLAKNAQTILKDACHRCHGAEGTVEGGFSYVLDRQQLISRKQILPGMAAKSRLMRRVLSNEMPPEGESPRLTKEQIALLSKWVDAGAPDFNPSQATRTFVTAGDMIKSMHADVQKRPATDRKFTRYLTLTHLYNAGRSNDELLSFQHGITKLVNSLSWGRRVVAPVLIGTPPTILRVDIRDYKWSAAVWDRLANADPYGLVYSNNADAKHLYEQTEAALPYVRGDWFVAAAARPPLYHDILQLPNTEKELEALLHVDVEENIRSAQVARAGFNGSAVSRNNRLIERHESSYGYYWKSYDFAKNIDRQNLFSHPLGPGTEDSDFRHDGGELIFSLPNGFQGYLLVNATGQRIDKGPTEIVSDPRQPDRAVENGLSCMSCHVRGMLPKDDQIGPHVQKNPGAFSKKELETVTALYPGHEQFQTLLQEDGEKFRKACEQAGMPQAISEPIKALATQFESELDLPLAAAEAGLKPDELQKLLAKSPALARELGSLQTAGGTVQRETYMESFGALARAARVGKPVAKSTAVASTETKTMTRSKTASKPTMEKDDSDVAPPTKNEILPTGWVELGGRNKFPVLLQSSKDVMSDKKGMRMNGRSYVRSKKGDYLTKDFKFEIVYTLTEGDAKQIMFLGLGEADPSPPYSEPKNSVYLGLHPIGVDEGRVSLSNKTGGGVATLGLIPRGGTHRAVIEKTGDTVTFSVDVDNDGPSDDDMEHTVPDIKAFGTYLNKKNTFIFFGGGGLYHRIRLSTPDSPAAQDEEGAKGPSSPAPEPTAPAGPAGKHTLLTKARTLPAPWTSKNSFKKQKEGIVLEKDTLVISKTGNYLKNDFVYEIVVSMKEGDGIGLVGIGNVNPNSPLDISQAVLFRVHPPGVSDGEVYMTAKNTTLGTPAKMNRAGTYLLRITKEGSAVTFAVDVDNDGESPDDGEYTIPDIKELAPFLHDKNTYLFFGHGGTFKSTLVTVEK